MTAIVAARMARPTLDFTGQPYQIKHEGAHPRPGNPSSGLRDGGGRIHGNVCGMFVDFDVSHKGDHVQLVGSIDNQLAAAIECGDERSMRRSPGTWPAWRSTSSPASGACRDTSASASSCSMSSGADYRGDMRIPGMYDAGGGKQSIDVVIHGHDALWAMPAADRRRCYRRS